MQAFEFAKKALTQLKRQKADMLAAQGNVAASEDDPIYLKLAADIAYDDTTWPVREIEVTFVTGEGDSKKKYETYTLEVPAHVELQDDYSAAQWLDSVAEFTSTCHGAAKDKAEVTGYDYNPNATTTRVFKNDYSVVWKIMDGTLEDLPLDSAAAHMDMLAKKTLDQWSDSPMRWDDDPDDETDYVEKRFSDPQQGQVVRDLLHAILAINGHSEAELDEKLRTHDDESQQFGAVDEEDYDDIQEPAMIIQMPREFLGHAISAEHSIDL